MGSRRAGRVFKRFLEAVGFILAEFRLKRSHGDPIRDNFYGFGTCELAQQCLRERYVSERDISLSEMLYIQLLRIPATVPLQLQSVLCLKSDHQKNMKYRAERPPFFFE